MIKNKHLITLICITLLLSAGEGLSREEDYIESIEIIESGIDIDRQQFPAGAYLCVTLKNNGDRAISNLNFQVKYYDEEDYLIQKAIVKNGLNEDLPPGEIRKYKMRLKGDIVSIANAQYPYERSNEVSRLDVSVISVKFSAKKQADKKKAEDVHAGYQG